MKRVLVIVSILSGLAISVIPARAAIVANLDGFALFASNGSLDRTTAIVGDTVTITSFTGASYELESDHCFTAQLLSSAGTLGFNSLDYPYSIHDCPAGYARYWGINGSGAVHVVIQFTDILAAAGDTTDTPAPTPTPTSTSSGGASLHEASDTPGPSPTPYTTATPAPATLPGLLPSPGGTFHWVTVVFPTTPPAGLLGQANLFTAPTAVHLVNTTYNFGFNLANEVGMANGAISMYQTANSNGAVNIIIWIFLAFIGVGLLFALVKRIGNR